MTTWADLYAMVAAKVRQLVDRKRAEQERARIRQEEARRREELAEKLQAHADVMHGIFSEGVYWPGEGDRDATRWRRLFGGDEDGRW